MRTHTKRQRRNGPGIQHLWGLDNGLLVSVVPDAAEEMLWALTVLDGTGGPNETTPIGRDTIGSLKPIDVRRILRQIEAPR